MSYTYQSPARRKNAKADALLYALRMSKELLDDLGGTDGLSQSGKDKYAFICAAIAKAEGKS